VIRFPLYLFNVRAIQQQDGCKYVRLRTCLCQKLMIRAWLHAQIPVDFKGSLTRDFNGKNRRKRSDSTAVLRRAGGLGGGGGLIGTRQIQ
jgi:hypothetical protein